MNFNTLLQRLGIDPDNFENRDNEPIKSESGFIYEVYQKTDNRKCPYCGSQKSYVNDHDTVNINCSETDQISDVLRIKKVRFKCRECGKTYTPEIKGIEKYSKTSNQTMNLIYGDFTKMMTFSSIAERYGLTTSRILQIFDEKVPFVPGGSMPSALCIDEIRFEGELDQKYCCVLYDFTKREIIDIIKNRQMPYLDEYFSSLASKERDKVKYFISDMYDGYRTVKNKYFSKAIHIVDLFHVISQMTNAINSIRTSVMKGSTEKGSMEYNFMKGHWKEFLCRRERISDKEYTHAKTKYRAHYDELVDMCVKKDKVFLEGYNILQDLYHYNSKKTFSEALDFMIYLSNRLKLTDNKLLIDVGNTYYKWRVEIANGLAKNQNGSRYTNSIAETSNNHLKTIIKIAYGYTNFNRFRKRALLISRHNKP